MWTVLSRYLTVRQLCEWNSSNNEILASDCSEYEICQKNACNQLVLISFGMVIFTMTYIHYFHINAKIAITCNTYKKHRPSTHWMSPSVYLLQL